VGDDGGVVVRRDSGPGTTGAWRPFSDTSPWNTPIPSGAAADSNSTALISAFATSSEWPFLTINIDRYAIPVYEANASTPRVAVEIRDVGGQGFDMGQTAPIPVGAMPDAESDHHLCIFDPDAHMAWDFFGMERRGDSWSASVAATIDLNGTGVRPPKDSGEPWWISHGARACGFPLLAGLIRVEEMRAGRIDHALAIAYPGIRSRYYKPPASTAQATFDLIRSDFGIPCGGRIQLDPSIDLGSLGLSANGMIIARALQEYGAYVGDFSGAVSLYADGSPDARSAWAGGLLDTYEVREEIGLTSFRVLEIGALKDDMN